jgi:hypothetical protein
MPIALNRPILLLFVLFFTLPVSMMAQEKSTRISGVITDFESGESLPSVNVYLSGTTTGAASDEDGYYVIDTNLSGEYVIIVSFLGYEPIKEQIFLEAGKSYDLDFRLHPDVLGMKEVEVKADIDREFLKRITEFREFFIGFDNYADEVRILNREVLNFEWIPYKKRYSVTSAEPLQLVNDAMGYEVELIIDRIEYDPFDNTGFWRVFSKYTEMETENRNKSRKWRRNRRNAWLGSSRHFFQSLYENKVKTNRFNILPKRTAIREITDLNELQQAFPKNWDFINRNYKVYSLEFIDTLIGYKININRPERDELSQLQINTSSGLLVIDRFGNIYRPETVQMLGKWGNDRFSKSLPVNYSL